MTHAALVDTDHQISKPKEEYPLTVREAAKYLGVSPQTVYLWVEQLANLRPARKLTANDAISRRCRCGKTQRPVQASRPAAAGVERDLEMAVACVQATFFEHLSPTDESA
jgi:transposase-like protein